MFLATVFVVDLLLVPRLWHLPAEADGAAWHCSRPGELCPVPFLAARPSKVLLKAFLAAESEISQTDLSRCFPCPVTERQHRARDHKTTNHKVWDEPPAGEDAPQVQQYVKQKKESMEEHMKNERASS